MKYSTVLLFALGAFALPQEDASITSAPASMPSASMTPQMSCLAACDDDDVNCRAECLGVARPNSSQAVETNECAEKCDQGDGSEEDTEQYMQCVQSCISSLFPSTQTAPLGQGQSAAPSAEASATSPGGTAASTGASPSGTDAQETDAQETDASGSPTSSGADEVTESGAANSNNVRIVGAGLAGLMAVFAL